MMGTETKSPGNRKPSSDEYSLDIEAFLTAFGEPPTEASLNRAGIDRNFANRLIECKPRKFYNASIDNIIKILSGYDGDPLDLLFQDHGVAIPDRLATFIRSRSKSERDAALACRIQEEIDAAVARLTRILDGDTEIIARLDAVQAWPPLTGRTPRDRAGPMARRLLGQDPEARLTAEDCLMRVKRVRAGLRKDRRRPSDPVFDRLHEIVEILTSLYFTDEELARIHGLDAQARGILRNLPAVNATYAEIVLAKIEGRRQMFLPVRGDAERVGVNLIHGAPILTPDFIAAFESRFEDDICQLLLTEFPLHVTDRTEKLLYARTALRRRLPDEEGCLYLLSYPDIHENDKAHYFEMLRSLAEKWPDVKFVCLDGDNDLRREQISRLIGFLDMLPTVDFRA